MKGGGGKIKWGGIMRAYCISQLKIKKKKCVSLEVCSRKYEVAFPIKFWVMKFILKATTGNLLVEHELEKLELKKCASENGEYLGRRILLFFLCKTHNLGLRFNRLDVSKADCE